MGQAFLDFFTGTNKYAGLVSISSFILMFMVEHYNINLKRAGKRHFIRLVIYCDAIAFFIVYTAAMLGDYLDLCSSTRFFFIGDFIWAFKDAFKYSYVVYRCESILNYRQGIISWAVFSISLALYLVFIATAYRLTGDCSTPPFGEEAQTNALLILYTFWMAVDGIAAIFVFRELAMIGQHVESASKFVTDIHQLQGHQQEQLKRHKYERRKNMATLLICTVLMSTVTVMAYIALSTHRTVWRISPTLFVFTQMVLFATSVKTRSRIVGVNEE